MNNGTGWFSKLILLSAIIVAILLPISALGHRFGLLGLELSFGLLRVSLIGGLLLIIAGVVNIVMGKMQQHPERVMQAWISIAVALIPVVVMAYQISRATSVPPIHNISTDVVNPPEFDRVRALRGEGTNPITYGSETVPKDQLVKLQKEAYPSLESIHTSLATIEAFDRALSIIQDQGLEVVNEDRGRGLIEAVDTSFWFGFKDDLVIRIQAEQGGTVVDLRSVSRVGQSDLGANANRINAFISAFEQ